MVQHMRAGNVEPGYTIKESWIILEGGFRKASFLISNKIRAGVPYFRIGEPLPESGYLYLHAGYFAEFSDTEKGTGSGIAGLMSGRPGVADMDLTFRLSKHTKTGDDTSL
jgi:hypothetical protein